MDNFRPNKAGTVSVSFTAAHANIALPNGGGSMLRLQSTANIVFCELSGSANTPVGTPGATGGGFPIFANQPACQVRLKPTDSYLTCVGTGNGTLYITRGDNI